MVVALWVACSLEWTVNGTCRHRCSAWWQECAVLCYGGGQGPKLLVWIIIRCSCESDVMERLASYANQLGEML